MSRTPLSLPTVTKAYHLAKNLRGLFAGARGLLVLRFHCIMPERCGRISQLSLENKILSQTDYEVLVIGAGVAGICQIKN